MDVTSIQVRPNYNKTINLLNVCFISIPFNVLYQSYLRLKLSLGHFICANKFHLAMLTFILKIFIKWHSQEKYRLFLKYIYNRYYNIYINTSLHGIYDANHANIIM